jgi:hypothetical protein
MPCTMKGREMRFPSRGTQDSVSAQRSSRHRHHRWCGVGTPQLAGKNGDHVWMRK